MVTLKKLDLSVLELPSGSQADEKIVALLSANALGSDEIAKRLGMEQFVVEAILNKPETTKLIFKLQSAFAYTPEQMLESALPFAIQRLIWLMKHSPDEKMQKQCITEVIDRVLGKPVQTLNTRNLGYSNTDAEALDTNFTALQKRLERLEDQKRLLRPSQVIDVN